MNPKPISKDDEFTIIDQEGKIMVNHLPEKINQTKVAKKLAELGGHLLTNIEQSLMKARLDRIESILIQGDKGKFCVLSSDEGKFFITLVGKIYNDN